MHASSSSPPSEVGSLAAFGSEAELAGGSELAQGSGPVNLGSSAGVTAGCPAGRGAAPRSAARCGDQRVPAAASGSAAAGKAAAASTEITPAEDQRQPGAAAFESSRGKMRQLTPELANGRADGWLPEDVTSLEAWQAWLGGVASGHNAAILYAGMSATAAAVVGAYLLSGGRRR